MKAEKLKSPYPAVNKLLDKIDKTTDKKERNRLYLEILAEMDRQRDRREKVLKAKLGKLLR